jgi:peptide/nickel transport system substrate-binding protein
VGIRTRLRALERAAFTAGFGERKLRGLILATSGAAGNAATRLESFAVSGSRYAYGAYPDIDGLFAEQSMSRIRGCANSSSTARSN